MADEDLGRDAHWFDGDGMLSGVAFNTSSADGSVVPEFVNQYILTDCLISSVTTPTLKSPILPSIATMVNPASGVLRIIARILRTILLVILSYFPGSKQSIKRISVANTGVFYHDGRALATCESGPPMRIQLPGLETVGWFNGSTAEGETEVGDTLSEKQEIFGGNDFLSFMKEWTTGHPKVDPKTGEMILYHSTFMAPYIHYSILPESSSQTTKLINKPVPGVSGAKMAHDFGVSATHSIILDLSLILDPFNLLRNKPIVTYDSSLPARFGVFPRRDPDSVRWFETLSCIIFHTANSWDELNSHNEVTAVNMLACRLTSASVVYSAGNITIPHQALSSSPGMSINDSAEKLDVYEYASKLESESQNLLYDKEVEEEQCRLYYWSFDMTKEQSNDIKHQFALSAIPFEFPTLSPEVEMSEARYIYGCSTSSASFGAALGRSAKIDVLVKVDALELISRGKSTSTRSVTGCVDRRSVPQIINDNAKDTADPIRCFQMPQNWYAQEARFVPRKNAQSEDDGYLLFYAFDESQLDDNGDCPESCTSELWVLDARTMQHVICKIQLPQRVPYGLHGNWFTSEQIAKQRDVQGYRAIPDLTPTTDKTILEVVRQYLVSALS